MPLPICLDIHGVCADFVGGFIDYHEIKMSRDYKELELVWPKGEYDIHQVTGHHWKDLPEEFWRNLPLTPDFMEITQELAGHMIIATTRIYTLGGAMGTFNWYLKYFDGCVFLPCRKPKGTYFKRDTILIDDHDEEIDAWQGPKILVPRPWNSGKLPYGISMGEYIRVSLERINGETAFVS